MKETAVPTDLTDHLAKSWPKRKLINEVLTIPASHIPTDSDAFLGQVESDLAVQVAIGLTHDQWVMLTSSGPQWWIRVDRFPRTGKSMTRQAWRAWDREREPLSNLPEKTVLKCEITGYAVPTFLDSTLWPLAPEAAVPGESAPAAAAEVADAAGSTDDVGQG